ncbi:MAG: DUF1311 domain-containing protein [Azoarcus sp.]|jgi:uncharacterized protein YecT (DUF1311 family)|nr:DUF1311 domain-containing protein [Azoarcus sp.]
MRKVGFASALVVMAFFASLQAAEEYGEVEYDTDVARVEAEEATCGVLTESSVREQCGLTFFHQVEILKCLKAKVAESEKTLKAAEKAAIEKIVQWDEDDKYINATRTAILVSGKTFLQYRKDHCALSASMAGGSLGASMRHDSCIIELNNRRAKQLHDFIDTIHLR